MRRYSTAGAQVVSRRAGKMLARSYSVLIKLIIRLSIIKGGTKNCQKRSYFYFLIFLTDGGAQWRQKTVFLPKAQKITSCCLVLRILRRAARQDLIISNE